MFSCKGLRDIVQVRKCQQNHFKTQWVKWRMHGHKAGNDSVSSVVTKVYFLRTEAFISKAVTHKR